MKKLIAFTAILFSLTAFAQIESNCNNINEPICCPSLESGYTPKILPWDKVGSKTSFKEALYGMFPKILTYKEFIYRDLFSSSFQHLEEYAPSDPPTLTNSKLKFSYCIPNTRQKMIVEITDFSAPFFQTKMGQAIKNLDLLVFNPQSIGLGAHNHSPLNKKYKNSVIMSARFSPYGGKSDSVSFLAFVKDRYLIAIEVEDTAMRFTEPIQVEKYLSEYISQIDLTD
ncbi:MAG: hypothetical protein KBE41_05900 [Lutibacter sp.]|nr:hypothetical protein [Lutibacter sp.]MBP9601014.1 hypothetical protein [Lutibacter sp.]